MKEVINFCLKSGQWESGGREGERLKKGVLSENIGCIWLKGAGKAQRMARSLTEIESSRGRSGYEEKISL